MAIFEIQRAGTVVFLVTCSLSVRCPAATANGLHRVTVAHQQKASASAIPEWKLDMSFNPGAVYGRAAMQAHNLTGKPMYQGGYYGSAPQGGSVSGSLASGASASASAFAGAYGYDQSQIQQSQSQQSQSQQNAGPAAFQPSTQANGRPSDYYAVQGIGSTPGQDLQLCPVMELPPYFLFHAQQGGRMSRGGKWVNSNGVVLGTWKQNLLSNDWETIYVQAANGKLSMKVLPASLSGLSSKYGWQARTSPADFPAIAALEGQLRVLNSTDPGSTRRADLIKTRGAGDLLAILDCKGALLLIASIVDTDPLYIDIYDRTGMLLAHSIDDPVVARSQFVDLNGYLLATAEAPAIGMNISRSSLQASMKEGDMMPYVMSFELGNYPNASELISANYRWVLAAVMQMRAIHEAQASDGQPAAVKWQKPLLYGLLAAAAILLCLALFWIYRCVFPSREEQFTGPTWASTIGPFLWSPEHVRLVSKGKPRSGLLYM